MGPMRPIAKHWKERGNKKKAARGASRTLFWVGTRSPRNIAPVKGCLVRGYLAAVSTLVGGRVAVLSLVQS